MVISAIMLNMNALKSSQKAEIVRADKTAWSNYMVPSINPLSL